MKKNNDVLISKKKPSFKVSNGLTDYFDKYNSIKNIPIEYQEALKFDGSSSDLSNKISSVFTLNQNEFLKIIEHSQEEIKNESLDTLVDRIERVI